MDPIGGEHIYLTHSQPDFKLAAIRTLMSKGLQSFTCNKTGPIVFLARSGIICRRHFYWVMDTNGVAV